MLVKVEDGVAVEIRGDPDMPFTDGTLCTKVAHYLERTYAPDRLRHPLKRVGPKGSGKFERIAWDAALDEIAARLKALAAEDPETILPLSYAGASSTGSAARSSTARCAPRRARPASR